MGNIYLQLLILRCLRKKVGNNLSFSCWSYVGRLGGGQQLNLGNGCDTIAVVVHETLHALGFLHEHNRPDRDQYVAINTVNIEAGKISIIYWASVPSSSINRSKTLLTVSIFTNHVFYLLHINVTLYQPRTQGFLYAFFLYFCVVVFLKVLNHRSKSSPWTITVVSHQLTSLTINKV